MKATNRLWRTLVTLLAFAGLLSVSSAAELNPAAVIYKLFGEHEILCRLVTIAFSVATIPAVFAVARRLFGAASARAAAFLVAVSPSMVFFGPHFHPNDRYIVVLQGTWWVGSGPKFDPANTTPMPAGSFVTHFGKQVHWDGAKDEDTVLLIMGEGPATSTAAEER